MPKDSAKNPPSGKAAPPPLGHRTTEPSEGRWAHAHGDAWVVADYSDGAYRCAQCRIALVVQR